MFKHGQFEVLILIIHPVIIFVNNVACSVILIAQSLKRCIFCCIKTHNYVFDVFKWVNIGYVKIGVTHRVNLSMTVEQLHHQTKDDSATFITKYS